MKEMTDPPQGTDAEMNMDAPEAPEVEEDSLSDWDVDTENTWAKFLEIWTATVKKQWTSVVPSQAAKAGEWHIIRKDPKSDELDHQSENPFNFLPHHKLDSLINYMAHKKVPLSKLSVAERKWYGRPKIRKILVKVVFNGSNPLEIGRRTTWFRAAICSAITQSRGKVADFNKFSCMAIDPLKKGYGWIVILVGAAIFKVLADVRAALDPKSGMLVLFRHWEEISCPKQRVYAIGLHREDDVVSLKVATMDYCTQMKDILGEMGVEILNMKATKHGDQGTYSTEITLGFKEGVTPFLIPPSKLTKRFWTSDNNKIACSIDYRWLAKCWTCESKSHLLAKCPWPKLQISRKKPNLINCRFYNPGWEEPIEGLKRVNPDMSAMVLEIGPRKGKESKSKAGEMVENKKNSEHTTPDKGKDTVKGEKGKGQAGETSLT